MAMAFPTRVTVHTHTHTHTRVSSVRTSLRQVTVKIYVTSCYRAVQLIDLYIRYFSVLGIPTSVSVSVTDPAGLQLTLMALAVLGSIIARGCVRASSLQVTD